MAKPNLDIIAGKAQRYMSLSGEIKELSGQKTLLSDELKGCAEAYGEVYDDKGSRTLEANGTVIKSVVREKQTINEAETLKILKKHKITDCHKEVVNYEFDKDAIERAVLNGKISPEELQQMITVTASRQVWVGEAK